MTPLMQQYWEIKNVHKDKILLYRMGDFYEMFFEDAERASRVLNIALTSRNKKSGDETPMCGFPHHSIAGPINKLLKSGFKVAICDQIEDPKLAKGLVKRAVRRVLTPGMVYDPDTLEESQNFFVMAFDKDYAALADPSSGEAFYFQLQNLPWSQVFSWPICEVILAPEGSPLLEWQTEELRKHFGEVIPIPLSPLKNQSEDLRPWGMISAYLKEVSPEDPVPLREFTERLVSSRLRLGPQALKHLEVFCDSQGEEKGSLFSAINRCKTSGGSRLLRERLRFPSCDLKEINQRLDEVDFWRQDLSRLKSLREQLARVGDLERRLCKVSLPTCNGRDLLSLQSSLEAAHRALGSEEAWVQELAALIKKSLVDDPPLNPRAGRVIREGVHEGLDEVIRLSTQAQELVSALEERERERTGIGSLKVRYNQVFGYYIEVTHTHKDRVPEDYRRKQTLANAERFYTDELLDLERRVLAAQSQRYDLESQIFLELRAQVLEESTKILNFSRLVSERDLHSSLAWLSLERNYSRPKLFENRRGLKLEQGRHPVVEQSLKVPFVANDVFLDSGEMLLLTGPNMAGKSTLMRQVALNVILGQMGSFVPCKLAEIPIFESIHTRIGSSDQLSQGFSTFMVEMRETSELLQGAGPRSLIVLDEIGRGTSTFDGLSLAQALVEHIQKELKCFSLFATHYHELTPLEDRSLGLKNFHMAVSERGGGLEFLHSLRPGPATRSYGIQVAELAGLPRSLTQRAKALLKEREKPQLQLSFLDLQDNSRPRESSDISNEILNIKLNEIPPLQVALKVQEIQEKIKKASIEISIS